MSYDNPNRVKYAFKHDFGDGDDVYAVRGPKGKSGTLVDYGVEGCTETFNSVTTEANVAVGTVADPDAYGEEFSTGDLAADDAISVRSQYDEIADAASFNTYMVDRSIPKDTIVALKAVGPTGGTPAGIGIAFMIIDWSN
jgi:hypothetical protein